jgi:hypothetical protein
MSLSLINASNVKPPFPTGDYYVRVRVTLQVQGGQPAAAAGTSAAAATGTPAVDRYLYSQAGQLYFLLEEGRNPQCDDARGEEEEGDEEAKEQEGEEAKRRPHGFLFHLGWNGFDQNYELK